MRGTIVVADVSNEGSEGESDNPERLLSVIATGTVVGMTGRMVLPAILPQIIEEFAITPSIAGLSLTVLVAGIGCSQYLGGRLSDQLSRKTVIVAALSLLAAGFALLSAAAVFPLFVVAAAIVGFGSGLYVPSSFSQLSRAFDARRGRAFGINAASFQLGSALGPGVAAAALAVGTWRLSFPPVVLLLLGVIWAMHRVNAEPYVVASVDLDVRATIRRIIAHRSIRRSVVAFGLIGFVWQGALNFLPTVLQVEHGYSSNLASGAFAAVFLIGMVATPVAGHLGDRLGHPTVAAGGLMTGVAGLGFLLTASSTVGVLTGILAFGAGIAAFWPTMDTHVMSLLAEGTRGGDFGAINTVNLAVGSLGPVYVGLVAERASYSIAFWGFVLPVLAAILVLGTLRRANTAE